MIESSDSQDSLPRFWISTVSGMYVRICLCKLSSLRSYEFAHEAKRKGKMESANVLFAKALLMHAHFIVFGITCIVPNYPMCTKLRRNIKQSTQIIIISTLHIWSMHLLHRAPMLKFIALNLYSVFCGLRSTIKSDNIQRDFHINATTALQRMYPTCTLYIPCDSPMDFLVRMK